ncbi:hypothetical protein BC830DRAFT_733908 [Chytriomyces sp. MP71]|nr:hypothetical protein BC830DRAFT_733908 [Chytriomyces sp. MP71]
MSMHNLRRKNWAEWKRGSRTHISTLGVSANLSVKAEPIATRATRPLQSDAPCSSSPCSPCLMQDELYSSLVVLVPVQYYRLVLCGFCGLWLTFFGFRSKHRRVNPPDTIWVSRKQSSRQKNIFTPMNDFRGERRLSDKPGEGHRASWYYHFLDETSRGKEFAQEPDS